MIGVTTAVIQDTRIKRKDNTYAIKLRVTFNRQQKYYPLGKHLTIEDWTKTQSERPRGIYKDDKLYFNEIENRANEIIRFLSPFSFALFEKKFNQQAYDRKNVFELLEACMEGFEAEGRINTADNFRYTKKSFEKFIATSNRKHLYLDDITVEWLTQYEKWMINCGSSTTTTGIYLRNLRTILNISIEEGNFNKENYPFGKRKYRIPSGRNIKKALAKSDIKKIIEYVPATKAEEKSRDLWLFSYLCNGINVADIAEMQYKDIHEKSIVFIRSKTKRSEKEDLKPIVVTLLPQVRNIIEKWGSANRKADEYVFQIISASDSSREKLTKVKQATKTINKYMGKIKDRLEIEKKITTYTARHSFATVLKRSGASIAFISESLGHNDIRTTESYMDSFEDDIKVSFQAQLLNFD